MQPFIIVTFAAILSFLLKFEIEKDELSIYELLSMVNKIDGLERIRFVTSHPKDFSINMINAMAENEKVYRYLHLPLQSGSNIILKAMNRIAYRYSVLSQSDLKYIANKFPDIDYDENTLDKLLIQLQEKGIEEKFLEQLKNIE